MGFDLFLQCFADGKPSEIPRRAVRDAFGPWLSEESQSVWRLEYGPRDSCVIYIDSAPDALGHLMISKPVANVRLWDALLQVMRLGNVVLYWPGCDPLLIADQSVTKHLPEDMVKPLGTPFCVHSGSEILDKIRSS